MAARTAYKRRAGEGIELPPETVARSIAPFEALEPDPDAFRDVQVGENKADGFIGFRATAGWDAATGLGTPRYDRLVEAAMKLP